MFLRILMFQLNRAKYHSLKSIIIEMNNLDIINEFVKLARISELVETTHPEASKIIDETIKLAAQTIEEMYPPIETPVVEYKYVPDSQEPDLDKIADDIYASDEFAKIKNSLHTKEASAKLDELINQKLA